MEDLKHGPGMGNLPIKDTVEGPLSDLEIYSDVFRWHLSSGIRSGAKGQGDYVSEVSVWGWRQLGQRFYSGVEPGTIKGRIWLLWREVDHTQLVRAAEAL